MHDGVREPVQAGVFYADSPDRLREHAQSLLGANPHDDLPAATVGGLVPHAGWTYSGRLVARTLAALAAGTELRTVVLFGADHTGAASMGEAWTQGAWRTPLGDVPIDAPLAAELLDACDALRANPRAHAHEHSLEVVVPLMQVLCPQVQIVPITCPPHELSVQIGQCVGRLLAGRDGLAVVGSTDLTHHGGGRFPSPGGRGSQGEQWATANDQRMLDLIERLAADEIVPQARRHHNACGAGAVAATVAAAREMGAVCGRTLQYTNSYRVVREMYPSEIDDTTVGYASVVFLQAPRP